MNQLLFCHIALYSDNFSIIFTEKRYFLDTKYVSHKLSMPRGNLILSHL